MSSEKIKTETKIALSTFSISRMSRARSFSKLCHGGKTALFISIPCAWNEMFFMSHWWCLHNLVGKGSTWHATPPVFPQKKVSGKKLHFLHQAKKTLIKPKLFRCRIGCRIFSPGELSYTNTTVLADFTPCFAWYGAGCGKEKPAIPNLICPQ